MPATIVVPLDGSKNAENALPWAAKLAPLYGATVEFVHVSDHEGAGTAEAETRFAEYAAGLAETWGIGDHRALVLRGRPAEAITEAAATALFIVIASHGRGGFRATFVGSVADKVMRAAVGPVVLVPAVGPPATPDERPVLVALDGSATAERGLEAGRDLAKRLGATVTLVQAWSLPVQATASFEPYYPTQGLMESVEAGAKEYLAATGKADEGQVVAMGYPSTVIAEVAAAVDAEIVVVTTSGKGLAGRITLGSTTERLAHSLHRPLLVVPVGD